jgi:N-acetylmuramoyl-L-alanine amidase
MIKYLHFIVLFLCVAAGANAAEFASFSVQKQQEIITLSIPKSSPNKVFTVGNPDRLVVDVPSAQGGRKTLSLPASYKGKLIKAARFGQFDPETSRFVFDLTRPVKVVDVTRKSGRLIITIGPASGKEVAQKSKVDKNVIKTKPADKPSINLTKKPVKSEKPLVVIDAGHGGVDPGTIGPKGTQEKDVVLEFGKALKTKLLKTGRYRVKLTRENDGFIMLRQRVAIARKAGGAIFISLHADSAPEQLARGVSVYTVSEKASDQEAEMLAAQENKSDVIAGMDLSEEREDVADILISLAQRETKNRSAMLADMLTTRIGDKVTLLPNPHRFAGFAVLKAPDIPSVLVETGFLSHPQEEKLLNSKAYREKVVSGIAAGIEAYFRQQQQAGAL